MTFKHIKFSDSPTMRSLEKIAMSKNWVKPEILKQASKQESTDKLINDVFAEDLLMTNVLKLCSGLRESGLDTFAKELENKFIIYKQADDKVNYYDVHKETGEDLIDQAHPKHGHQMEDMSNKEAYVETILEKHLKILDMVNKEPKGKLASSKDILKAVKIVLADNQDIYEDFDPSKEPNKSITNVDSDNKYNVNLNPQQIIKPIDQDQEDKKNIVKTRITNNNNKIKQLLTTAVNTTKEIMDVAQKGSLYNSIRNQVYLLRNQIWATTEIINDSTAENIKGALSQFTDFFTNENRAFSTNAEGAFTKDHWDFIKEKAPIVISAYNQALQLRNETSEIEERGIVAIPGYSTVKQINYKPKTISPGQKQEQKITISTTKDQINKLIDRLDHLKYKANKINDDDALTWIGTQEFNLNKMLQSIDSYQGISGVSNLDRASENAQTTLNGSNILNNFGNKLQWFENQISSTEQKWKNVQ